MYSFHIPIKWYAQETEEADDELKMNPVGYEVSQQSVETQGDRPEDSNHRSSECAIVR